MTDSYETERTLKVSRLLHEEGSKVPSKPVFLDPAFSIGLVWILPGPNTISDTEPFTSAAVYYTSNIRFNWDALKNTLAQVLI